MAPEWQTVLIIVSNVIVGIILFAQIKSQKEIINNYKGLVEATNPDKIIALQKREVEQLITISSNDKTILQNQLFELANYALYQIENYEWLSNHVDFQNPEVFFNTVEYINEKFPASGSIVNKLWELRQKQVDSVKANQ
jgi:hypothetical protein